MTDTLFTEDDLWGLDNALCKATGDALVRLAKITHGYPVQYREVKGHKHAWHDYCAECSQLSATAWTEDLYAHGAALLAYAGPDGFSQIYEKYKDTARIRKIEELPEWEKQILGDGADAIVLRRDFHPYIEEADAIDDARIKGAKKAFKWIAKNLESLWD